MNSNEIKARAEGYSKEMIRFLRDLVRIRGVSNGEGEVANRILDEMKLVGFNRTEIDKMGNVLGYMGNGKKLLAFDAHIDTVDIGEKGNWKFDPYIGYENDSEVGGRGTSDQLGGIVSAIYAAKILKDLNLITDDYTFLVTGTVQEEECEGLNWQYIINEDKVRPDVVVLTEPTNGKICRGHRGRMDIRVEVKGVSAHGSAPERGNNAIYKMAKIINEIELLNDTLKEDDFLGKGTLTVSQIFYNSPSRCAVADMCAISIDRRLTNGETSQSALEEIRNLPTVKAYNAAVTIYYYDEPSYTGLVYTTDCYFPTWTISKNALCVKALVQAHQELYGEPVIDKWTFSTNGVAIMGHNGIPCVGFGPGKEEQAHAPNEITWKTDLIKCAAVYAAMPIIYCEQAL